jgi:hypothetical protein
LWCGDAVAPDFKGLAMLFAAAAASTAVDILSQLIDKASAKGGTGVASQTGFEVAEPTVTQAMPSSASAGAPSESLSRDTLDTLLSAQGQAQGTERKKRSLSVLLNLMQSSQNGSVSKSQFEAAASKDGKDGKDGAALFDKIDGNHDGSVNPAELSAFLDSYRRASANGAEASAAARSRSLSMTA